MAEKQRRKKRLIPEKTKNIKPMFRDSEMIHAVFTHRLLRTTHIQDLFSGGEAIATLEPGTEGELVGGPSVIADERFFKLRVGEIEGWITEDYLALPGRAPAHAERVQTKTVGFIRPRPGGSPQTIGKRPRLLMDHYFLDGVEEPESYMRHRRRARIPGSEACIYGVGDKGADLLAQVYGLERGKVRWREKNRELGDEGPRGKKHILATADVIVPIIVACQARDAVDYIPPSDILRATPEATRKSRSPYLWKVTASIDGRQKRMSATPDKLFALHLAEREEARRRRYFLLEVDRASEPNERENVTTQSSIIRKLITFGTGYRKPQEYHKKRFNIPTFRCLIITTSAARVENMMALVARLGRDMGIPVNLFYFTHFAALKADADDALSHKWLTHGRNEIREITLLD